MILTEKLELKKPEKQEPCSIEDLNYNMDKIDSDIFNLKEHSELSVCSEVGVHGMRYIEDDLQVYGEDGWYSLVNETEYQAPGNMRKFEVIAEDEKAKLTFLEPEDVINKGIVLCKVTGVMIRYSTEKYPESITEGTLVIDNKDLGKYDNEPFVLEGLTNKTKYYFSAFAYSIKGLYNLTAGKATCIPSGKGKLEIRSAQTCKVKIIIGEEQEEITVNSNQPYIAKYIGGTQITVKPGSVEGRFMLEGGGTYIIAGDETTTVVLSITAIPETLNACSWDLIKKISDARQMKQLFKIGDIKDGWILVRENDMGSRFILKWSPDQLKELSEPYNYIPKEGEHLPIRKVRKEHYSGQYTGHSCQVPNGSTNPNDYPAYQFGFKVTGSTDLRARAYGFNKEDNLKDFSGEFKDIKNYTRDVSYLMSSGVKRKDGKIQIYYTYVYDGVEKLIECEPGLFSVWKGLPRIAYVIDL